MNMLLVNSPGPEGNVVNRDTMGGYGVLYIFNGWLESGRWTTAIHEGGS